MQQPVHPGKADTSRERNVRIAAEQGAIHAEAVVEILKPFDQQTAGGPMPFASVGGQTMPLSRTGIMKISPNSDIYYGQEALSHHWLQGDQERLDPLGNIDDLDSHRQVFGQFQEPGGVQVAAAAEALHATTDSGPGNPPLLAQLNDCGIQRLPVPLVIAVDIDGHELGIGFDLHNNAPIVLEKVRPSASRR